MGTDGCDSHMISLLQNHDNEEAQVEQQTRDGSLDIHGNPCLKYSTGNWRACRFILGTECSERFAYSGIKANLVTYLKTNMHQGNAAAAKNVMLWSGTCHLTTLLGALLADSYLGKYWTILSFTSIYFLGMMLLTISAAFPALQTTTLQYCLFYSALYMVALGTGGIKPCVSSFGADQFDVTDPKERKKKSSFFNWFYFSINLGSLFASTIVVWVQDNLGWGWGFGIPTVFIAIAMVNFVIGTSVYRFQMPRGTPFTRICQVIVASLRNSQCEFPEDISLLYGVEHQNSKSNQKFYHIDDFRFLDKAAILPKHGALDTKAYNPWKLCTLTQVEELKILLRMFPIWITGIAFSAVYAQSSTTFVEQGAVMDKTLGSFQIPSASLSLFRHVNVMIWVPIYDSLIVPFSQRYTGQERGFTHFQRMGIGLIISIMAMIIAAMLEAVRLDTFRQHFLTGTISATVPISILWQIPQYCLIGVAEVFFFIGQLEFFYDQSPDAIRSVCTAFFLIAVGLGDYINSLLIIIITSITTRGGKPGWIPDNLNEGHLDYYFWILVSLSLINLCVFIVFAMKYKYKK